MFVGNILGDQHFLNESVNQNDKFKTIARRKYAIYHEKCNTKGHTLILAICLLHTKLYFYVHYRREIYIKFDNNV